MNTRFFYLFLAFFLCCFLSSAGVESFNEKLKEGYKGKIDTVPFGIGTKSTLILKKYGKPEAADFFEGWYYLKYKELVYFIVLDDISKKDQIGIVRVIGVSKGFKLFGVQVGMNMQNIQKILGKCDYKLNPSGNEDDQNELLGGNYLYGYLLGEYELLFTSESENAPTNGAYLAKQKALHSYDVRSNAKVK
jgi:hypothetical protein